VKPLDAIILAVLIAALALSLHLGGQTGERQHRNIERQFDSCVKQHAWGSPELKRCMR
jgi:hypothetical protein